MSHTSDSLEDPEIDLWEEHAFYESGLSADGCFDKLDDYAIAAIKRYGRLLLKYQSRHIQILSNATQ
jgi:hypothetical protein